MAAALLSLLALVPAAQAKFVVGGYGPAGTLGGQLGNSPRGVAVNDTGAGGVAPGTFYVVDGNQNRVQRFSPTGAFERTWGFDVETGGVTTFEICTVAANCKAGVTTPTTANGGQLNNAQGVAVNQSTGDVYVTETGNRRVSQFDANGNFVRAWGQGVATGSTTTFETCTTMAGCRQAVAAGGMAGQLGTVGYPTVDSSGDVWVPDQTSLRMQEFSSTGAFLRMAGGGVVSGGAEGTGDLNPASTTVSALNTTKKAFVIGQTVTGPGIKPGTVVTNIAPGAPSNLTLSQTPAEAKTATMIVAAEGAGNVPTNERQTVTIGANTIGGTFTLTVPVRQSFIAATATAIPFNASPAAVEAKLAGLAGLGGNVSVTSPNPGGGTAPGGPYTVEFTGARYVDTNLPQLTAAPAGLQVEVGSGAKSIVITTLQEGASGAEVCAVASECQAGAPGSQAGQFGASSPGDIALDSSGNLFAIDSGNKRVQKFDPALSSASSFGTGSLAPYTNVAVERMISTQGGSRLAFAVNNTVSAVPAERQIVELNAADASFADASLLGAKLGGPIGGLGFDSATGTLYATTAAEASPRRILALSSTPLPAPIPLTSPVTTKTDSTATFTGTIDPNGGFVSGCKFQYSTDQAIWTDVAIPAATCAALTPGGGPQAVSASVTGLVPNMHYFVRLAVSRVLLGNSNKNSAPQGFDTDSVPPVVTDVGAVDIQDASVRLVGTIDPRHSDTSYVFEYGTTSGSLDLTTDPIGIGGGSTPLTVSQLVTGLSPATTYYLRLVATNQTSSTASGEKAVTTRATPIPPPEDRAYEQVSPVDKGFGNIDDAATGKYRFAVAEDGHAVGYCNITAGGALVSEYCGEYLSQRTPTGWHARPAQPMSCGVNTETSEGVLKAGIRMLTFSRDFSHAAIMQPENATCGTDPLSPDAHLPGTNLYRETLDSPDFAPFSLLAPAVGTSTTTNYPFHAYPRGGDDDFSHIAFTSSGAQTAEAVTINGTERLYEWDEGTVRLVAKTPANAPINAPSQLAGNPDPVTGGRGKGYGAVSEDGNSIYFASPVDNSTKECSANDCELYVRLNGTTTHWASEQECTVACSNTAAPDLFRWATPDGSKALFETTAKLVDSDAQSSGNDLYLYRDGPDPATESNLTLLSADSEPADGITAAIQGVMGLSDDADTVFFIASGQLVAGGPTATGPKMYRWRWNGGSPSLVYLGRLVGSGAQQDSSYIWAQPNAERTLIRRVDPAGTYLLVDTINPLDPIADRDTSRDVYRWTEQTGWLCLSCQLPGTPSLGESTIKATTWPYPFLAQVDPGEFGEQDTPMMNSDPIIVSSDDGSRVFFTSKDPLVAEDINTVADVYEWNDGRVSLITGGRSAKPAKLVGTTRSGDDVFFITPERLVGWDTDGLYDIYDARVGGGFPEPPPTGAVCEGEACRGAGSAAPTATGAGSAAFEGPGNSSGEVAVVCRKQFRKVRIGSRTVCRKKKKPQRGRAAKRGRVKAR